jgi:DNA-binding response OmpR family regulator
MPEPRILVLDDEELIGELFVDYLAELGYETVGPVTTLSEAAEIIKRETISAAILDVFLKGGTTSYPLAEILMENKTPFAFSTGYNSNSIAPRFSDVKTLTKPFLLQDLRALIESWHLGP